MRENQSSHCGSVVTNPTSIHEDEGLMPGLAQCVKDLALPLSCGAVCRCSLDPVLLWLWHRSAAVTLILPLAWELPYASGAVRKGKKINERNSSGEENGVNKCTEAWKDTVYVGICDQLGKLQGQYKNQQWQQRGTGIWEDTRVCKVLCVTMKNLDFVPWSVERAWEWGWEYGRTASVFQNDNYSKYVKGQF